MNIGQTNPPNTSSDNRFLNFFLSKNYWVGWRPKILVVLFISAIILFGSFSFYLGAMAHREHIIRGQFLLSIKEIVNTNYHTPLNYIRSWFSVPEKITIDMKFKHLQRIEFNRNSALKNELIADSIKDVFHPAELTFNKKKFDAKISLYGTFLDHINSNQYSMRVKLKKGAIMGMRKFVLMNPKVRYGLYDWFSHKLMKFEDLIHLRYKFVDVSLNGEAKGTYILEELFDKLLIGNNRYREGLILVPELNPIKIYREDKLLLDPSTEHSVYLIKELFKSYRKGVLHPKLLFDYQKMSRFLAVIKLLGGEHALLYDNIRFFFNPITGRLEPIGREFNIKTKLDLNIFKDELYRHLLIDPEFVTLYVQNLVRLSKPEYLDNLFSKLDLELRKNERYLHRQQPYHSLDKKYFYQQQKKIISELTLSDENIQTFYTKKGNDLVILLENSSNYPLKINSFFSTSKILGNLFTQALGSNTIISQEKTSIILKIPGNKMQEVTESLMNMKISLKIVGSSIQYISLVTPSNYGSEETSFDLMRKLPNPDEFSFLQLNEKDKKIYFNPGKWIINKDMIIPPGFIVHSFPGTQLNLKNGASIISYSPLKFYGTETNPISILSDDGKGRGIVVLNTGKSASKFYNVVFNNLSRPKGLGWSLTSAVTFYESNVHFDKISFQNNHDSDDSLNIFRSNFSITRSKFSNSFADALDIDFSSGSITDVLLLDCGTEDKNGDCLDISGSNLTLKRIRIDGAGDKAISVGENSMVVASEIYISNATVGVVSKDSSEIKLDGLTISECSFDFAAYQKKPEFGPASIIATNFSSESIETLHILERGSSLILNGTPIVQFSKKHPLERITEAIIPLTRMRNASSETLQNF